MSYAIFDNMETFNVWHDGIKTKLNYPIYGKNEATSKVDKKHPITEFALPLVNPDDPRIVANVEDETEGLTLVIREEYAAWLPANWIPIG